MRSYIFGIDGDVHMRGKKYVIRISFMIGLASLVFFTIVLNCGELFMGVKAIEWCKTVFAGMFTSAIVTLLISVGEYRVEKRKALEEFISVDYSLIYLYRNLMDLDTEIPVEMLQAYFHEEMSQCPPGILEPDETPKANIMEFLWKQVQTDIQELLESSHKKDEYLEAEFNRAIAQDRDAISEAIKQYRQLCEAVNLHGLSTAYGNIDFMFANKKVREELLYNRIYEPHSNAKRILNELNFHLKNYEEAVSKGHVGNLPVVIMKILEVQEHFLEMSKQEHGTAVYKKFVFDMDTAAYEVLKYLYGKDYKDKEPEKKNYLAKTYCKLKNDEALQEN